MEHNRAERRKLRDNLIIRQGMLNDNGKNEDQKRKSVVDSDRLKMDQSGIKNKVQ